MIDKSFIGSKFGPYKIHVEKWQLKFFAKAIGEENSIYFDEHAARNAGFPSIPAPPTFGFTIKMKIPDPMSYLTNMGVGIGQILHGEQLFEHSALIFAGDCITVEDQLIDIYDKKDGALEFVVNETHLTNQHDILVGKMKSVTVVRN